jgi:hypothetical protein
MADLEGETSNSLFGTLENWNTYLKAENIDFDDLPTEPRKQVRKKPVQRHGPTP